MTSDRRLPRQLAALFLTRTTVCAGLRIVYPFLPSIARGLGISLTSATSLVSLRMLPGLVAPFLGPVADRAGRRRSIEVAMLLFVAGSLSLAAWGTLTGVAVGLMLMGLAKVVLDPSTYALVGDAVPYARRGRTIGLLELSWSASWLVGVPAAAVLIERWGWRSPWWVLAVLGLVGAWLIWRTLPPGRPPVSDGSQPAGLPRRTPAGEVLRGWGQVWRRKGVRPFLLVGLLLTLAIEIPFIVYGAWLEDSFGLSLSKLGLASMVVGLAEVAAELGSSAYTDRWGKRNSILVGLVGLAAGLVALPWLSQLGLAGALLGIALAVLAFEFAIVSLLPLATELVPTARASLLSFNVTAITVGRMLGSVTGGWLWSRGQAGIGLNAWVGALCAAAAAALLIAGLPRVDDEGSSSQP